MSGNQSLLFNKDGVDYPITIKGKQAPWSLDELHVVNKKHKRIPLSVLAQMHPQAQAMRLEHTNQMRSLTLCADLPLETPYEPAMQRFTQVIDNALPPNYQKIWSPKTKLFKKSRETLLRLFFLALIFIFAILAIQFENIRDPFIILLTVPLACLGGLGLMWATGQSMNIYTQIGLVTLIGLITKHGILIVAFANELKGKLDLKEAIIEASTRRLRPILMTTAAMVFGALPLIWASGAGAQARQALGTVLVGGLTFGTLFTLFILPSVCLRVQKRFP